VITLQLDEETTLVAEGLLAEPQDDAELSPEDLTEDSPQVEAHLTHQLQCRRGLGNAYVYDDTWFKPDSSCEMWTKTAFYTADTRLLLATAWRYKGGGNPYATYGNRWTWRNIAVGRSFTWWRTGVSDGSGGYSNIALYGSWANCS
jgi:hypothetical protein